MMMRNITKMYSHCFRMRSYFGIRHIGTTKTPAPRHSRIEEDILKVFKPIAPNDTYISCSILDKAGNVVAVSKKFPKAQFLHQSGLFARDLRKIDTSTVDVIPTIAVRSNCILVNLLHIKAIVKKDTVMVFDTSTSSSASKLGLFIYDLEAKLKAHNVHYKNVTLSPGQYYEFKALESIFINVMSCLETELQHHLRQCGTILHELEDQIDRDKLRDLLIKSKSLTSFYQKAHLIRNVLDEVLDNDEDLEAMCLSRKLQTKEVDTAEIEMLLEAYYKQCDEFVQQAETLMNDIKSTEEIINIILDANRNSLMLFELKITIYTLGFTMATSIPAFYGMNLKNYIEESNYGFGLVVMFSVLSAAGITLANFARLRSVQKLTMMLPSESRRGSHGSPSKKARFFGMMSKNKRQPSDPKQRDMIWRWLLDGEKK